MNDIKVISLITGEDILAKAKPNDSGWDVEKPVVFGITEDQAGNQQLGFQKWKPFSKVHDEGTTIFHEGIMFVSDPIDEIANAYNQQFGTGLVAPPSGVTAPPQGEGSYKFEDYKNE